MLLTGKVNLALFVYKYGAGQSALMGITLLLILLIAIRIIYGLGAWLVSPVTGLFGR